MKLSEVSVQRPVFATVMSLAIVLLGVISYTRLPVRESPDIDPPIVSVSTFYRGASPSVVETEITDVLEETFSTLEGVKSLSSSSQEQGSNITIEFELNRDVDEAANDVRDRVSRARGSLPNEAEDPVVEKVDTNAQPIVWLALQSDVHGTLEMSDLADRALKDRLQRLPGVGSVFIGGERRYAMRVWLDPQRLAARGLTAGDVAAALARENAEIPAGRVEGEQREFAVRTRGELYSAEEFGAVVVATREGGVVRLRDVADVAVGAEDERTVTRYNGLPSIGMGVVKQGKASTLEVAAAVRDALPALREELPPGMRLEVAFDSSLFISESIHEVRDTLLIAVALVILVILVFLKSLRATLIPVLAIPVSIVGAATVALALGFTINILTLLALVLAIGLVVDDAIVVLENIFRHIEEGYTPFQAALKGVREISFAVVAMTLTLAAVFAPLAFTPGRTGRLFSEFALTLAGAVLVSGFVALTLTPMMCSKLLRHNPAPNRFDRGMETLLVALTRIYARMLRWALAHRWVVVLVMLGSGAGSAWLYGTAKSELSPQIVNRIGVLDGVREVVDL